MDGKEGKPLIESGGVHIDALQSPQPKHCEDQSLPDNAELTVRPLNLVPSGKVRPGRPLPVVVERDVKEKRVTEGDTA